MVTFFNQYEKLWENVRKYWQVYGGTREFIRSPFLHFSLIFSLIIVAGSTNLMDGSAWLDMSVSVLPSMLGFTLAAYVVIISISGSGFVQKLGGKYPNGQPSPLLKISAAFFHFILVQVTTLLYILAIKGIGVKSSKIIIWMGIALFCYAILTGLGAALSVWTTSCLLDKYLAHMEGQDGEQ